MDIRIENDTQRPTPRQHVLTRMTRALRRIQVRPVTAHVAFADLNGPKGGLDVRCALRVTVQGQPPVVAEGVAVGLRLAFDQGHARLVRRLERAFARWQESRRRPKKYFVAKRLLSGAP